MRKAVTALVLLLVVPVMMGCSLITGRDSGFNPERRTTYFNIGRTINVAIVNGTPYQVNVYKFDSSERPVGSMVPFGVTSIRYYTPYYTPFVNRRARNEIGLVAIAFNNKGQRVGYETKKFRPRNRAGTQVIHWEIKRLRGARGLRR